MKLFLYPLFFALSSIISAESAQLYEVDISNQSLTTRQALQIVINRLTPGPNDPDNPLIATIQPEDYIHSTKIKDNKPVKVRFDSESIKSLMWQAGQQPWLINRPKMLTYVCLNEGIVFKWLSPRQDPLLFEAITQSAKTKGLELEFVSPGEQNIKYDLDLKQRSTPQFMLQQSNISNPEAVLVINIYRPPHISTRYEHGVILYKNRQSMDCGDRPIFSLAKAGIPSMIQASQFLFESGEEKKIQPMSVDVRVHNVQNAHDFSSVQEYLQSIPGIKSISLNSVTADTVLYTLESTISRQLLLMRLNKKYLPLPQKKGEDIDNYRLTI